jgi:hypothetical protein
MGYEIGLCLDHDVIESDASLLCPVCSMILYRPERSDCGHFYCKACLKKLRRCKICDTLLKTYSAVPEKSRELVPVLLLSKLGTLTVRCAQGCDAVMRLKEFDDHCARVCPKTLVPCTNHPVSCKELVPRYLLRDHLDNYCIHRRVSCGVCGFKTVYANLYIHERKKRCGLIAALKRENIEHNGVSNKIKDQNGNLLNWSRWSQYNYVKQTDVKRDFIATLYATPKIQTEVDTSTPQFKRMLRYEQSHSVIGYIDPETEEPRPPNTVLPTIAYRPKTLVKRSHSVAGTKPPRLFLCQRCEKVHADNIPRSHKECRWHVGPILLNTFGSTCSKCKRPSYQLGCQYGRHILVEIEPTRTTAVALEDSRSDGEQTERDKITDRMNNPTVSPIPDGRQSIFITQSQ